MTAHAFTLTVEAQNLGAPAWLRTQTVGTWRGIAGPSTTYGAGGTLDAVKPLPETLSALAAVNSGFGSFVQMTKSWTGAYADLSRKEYGMCANGGHADYGGNETYALGLTHDHPKWVRLNTPTTAVVNDYDWLWRSDGRARAMHNSGHQQYVNGRVWFNMMTSTSGGGSSFFETVSFDRSRYPTAVPGTAAIGYGVGVDTTNPWITNYGPMGGLVAPGTSTDGIHFANSALDEVTGNIWQASLSATGLRYWVVRTNPYSTQAFSQPSLLVWSGAFSCVASELRLWIVGIVGSNQVMVKSLTSDSNPFVLINLPNDGFNWDPQGRRPYEWGQPPAGVNALPPKMSSNYHHARNSIFIVDPYTMGKKIRQLTIPTSGGAYNPAGTWAWTTLDPAVTEGTFSDGLYQGTFNKCRLFPDIGGSAVLVHCDDVLQPTFVYRIS